MQYQPRSRSADTDELLVRRFKDFHQHLSLDTITGLEEIYTQDIEFISPIRRIQGSLGLKKYLKNTSKLLENSSMGFRDTLVGEHCAFLAWELELCHPRLAGGRPRTLHGISYLLFSNRVYYQEDSWDMGALLYDHVPLLGRVTAFLKKRIFSNT